MLSYIATEEKITININGVPKIVRLKSLDHRNYLIRLVTLCQQDPSEENMEELKIALSPFKKIQNKLDSRVEYIEEIGKLFIKGIERPLPEVLQKRILNFLDSNLPIDALIKFWENCQLNPEFRAVEELYLFLEHNGLPITSDGCFVAYKKVNKVDTNEAPREFEGLYLDKLGNCRNSLGKFVGGELKQQFKDWLSDTNKKLKLVDGYTGKFDNSVGQTVSMPRNEVNPDRTRTCEAGIHFASWEYAKGYGGDVLIMVKINPSNVVAIPNDYNNQKGRCCEYEVIGIINEEMKAEYLEYNG